VRILITGGGTEEPVDRVRSICNFSTGKTASFLAGYLASRGFSVTALMAERAVKPQAPVILHTYRTFPDLEKSLQILLSANRYDCIIHAAAVSDYRTELVEINGLRFRPESLQKIPSGADVVIRLKENPKLIDNLRSWSVNGGIRIIAFKLTDGDNLPAREKAVETLFSHAKPDLVVSNDRAEMTEGLHPARIYGKKAEGVTGYLFSGSTLADLGDFLCNYCKAPALG
jgi:phosphopantothenoylcysteine synthetase/decarboxylase